MPLFCRVLVTARRNVARHRPLQQSEELETDQPTTTQHALARHGMWQVVSSTGPASNPDCTLTSNFMGQPGMCVTDGAGYHGDNERCTFRAVQDLYAHATYFDTDAQAFITIGGQRYSGTGNTGPANAHMTAGSTMTWSSGTNLQRRGGFTICATTNALLFPPPPPPSPSPPSAQSHPHHLPAGPIYAPMFGYGPASDISDQAAIDRDQRSLKAALSSYDFGTARSIYERGGWSGAYAEFAVPVLPRAVRKSTMVSGVSAAGTTVTGIVSEDTPAGGATLLVRYRGDACHVGGLPNPVSTGCFANATSISVSGHGTLHPYYVNSANRRTLRGFSTRALSEMITPGTPTCTAGPCLYHSYLCQGCPYKDALMYENYYQTADYADRWILGALDGTSATFTGGAGDTSFASVDASTRVECAQRGTVYLSVWMWVLRKLEEGLDDCAAGCVSCNDHGTHAWDEAVAFYTGSLAANATSGEMLFSLANSLCAHYNTCAYDGLAAVNVALFTAFTSGQGHLTASRCAQARPVVERIADLMSVPLIQGALRAAYQLAHLGGGRRERAAGAAFAAAILPRLAACDVTAASTVNANLRLGATRTVFEDVQRAFETHYNCLNVTCGDIGGLWDGSVGSYMAHFSPCVTSPSPPPIPAVGRPSSSSTASPPPSSGSSLPPATAPGHRAPPAVTTESLPSAQSAPHPSLAHAEVGLWVAIAVCFLVALLLVIGHVYRRRRRAAAVSRRTEREAAEIALTEAALVLRVGALKTRKFELGDDSRARTDTHEAPAPPECAVCLVAFESGEKIKTLPCGHEFHLKCVDAWMLAKKPAVVGDGTLPKPRPTCPLCKADPFAAQDRKVQEAISVTRLS